MGCLRHNPASLLPMLEPKPLPPPTRIIISHIDKETSACIIVPSGLPRFELLNIVSDLHYKGC